MFERAKAIGKKLLVQRLIDGASGNMSFRVGDEFYITKTGVMLDELDESSFVKMKIFSDEYDRSASSDQLIHREVYKNSNHKAVLHCHGVYAVVLSFLKNSVIPMDLEGRHFLGEVKVVIASYSTLKGAKVIAEALKKSKAVIVRGHGIYCAGEDLDEAYRLASYLEHSCELIYKLYSRKY